MRNFLIIFSRSIPMAVICEDLPDHHNYLELDHNNKDIHGMPGIKVNYKISDNTKKCSLTALIDVRRS